jgi:hypothetical protein
MYISNNIVKDHVLRSGCICYHFNLTHFQYQLVAREGVQDTALALEPARRSGYLGGPLRRR